jgi:hypothetical protein
MMTFLIFVLASALSLGAQETDSDWDYTRADALTLEVLATPRVITLEEYAFLLENLNKATEQKEVRRANDYKLALFLAVEELDIQSGEEARELRLRLENEREAARVEKLQEKKQQNFRSFLYGVGVLSTVSTSFILQNMSQSTYREMVETGDSQRAEELYNQYLFQEAGAYGASFLSLAAAVMFVLNEIN